MKRLLIRALDCAAAWLAYLSFPLLRGLARADRRLPLSRKAMDLIGISVIPHHYYSPMMAAADLRMPLDVPRPLPGLDMNAAGQLRLVGKFSFRDELLAIPMDKTSTLSAAYRNKMFGPGDAEMLHNVIRSFKPRTFVEIGCGESTLFALGAQALNAEEGTPCRHICVEPYENGWLEQTSTEIVRKQIEDVDSRWLAGILNENDVLFIDSSHMIRPQGDVLYEYLQVLPMLKPGVVVHVHDIFTPRDYPESWIIGDRRLWNEQYLLEAFLSFNSQFEILLAVNWLYHEHKALLGDACPVLMSEPRSEPGSFWFWRKPGAA